MGNLIGKAVYLYCAIISELACTLVNLFTRAGNHTDGVRKRLLIIRTDLIGDFILFLGSFRAYRRLYPEGHYEITLLGNKSWGELAEEAGLADHYIFIDPDKFYKKFLYKFRVLKMIRKIGFDIAVHPVYSRAFEMGDAVIRVSGAKERIGSTGDLTNTSGLRKFWADRFYTRLVSAAPGEIPELERQAEFLRNIGLADFKASCPRLDIAPIKIAAMAEKFGLPEKYYILFPCASRPLRQWPVEKFAKLANHLYEKTGWTGIIAGGPGGPDREIGEKLRGQTGAPLIDLTGKTSIFELACIIASSKLLAGNETSGIHIAAATGIPVLCILGGGQYGRCFPYGDPEKNRFVTHQMDCFGCNWRCIYKYGENEPVPCIREVSETEVFGVADEMVEAIENTGGKNTDSPLP